MKILINFDIRDGQADKAVRLYDMRGNSLGKGQVVLDRPVSEAGTLFTPTIGYITFQAELDDNIIASYLQPDKAIFTPEQWRMRYLSNSFIIPKVSDEQWEQWLLEWRDPKNAGKIIFLPDCRDDLDKDNKEEVKIPTENPEPAIQVFPPEGTTITKRELSQKEKDDIDDLFKDLL